MTNQMARLQSEEGRNHATESEKESARSAEGFWPHRAVSPGRRQDDASRFKLTLRDVVLLLVGVVGMYGAQLGAQWGLRSDIRDLKTSFDAYQQQQGNKNTEMQRQIDEWRQETKLNGVYVKEMETKLAELKGILVGAGVKGITK